MAVILQFERPTTPMAMDSITQSIKALGIATSALAEIAEAPGPAGDRALQGLRDIKQVIVDG
jgi:hypothetical protein